jgi:hypothetical protein
MICDPPVPVGIYSLHDLVQELIRIFQGYSILLATLLLRSMSALTVVQLPQSLFETGEVKMALLARVEGRP